jgi:transposase
MPTYKPYSLEQAELLPRHVRDVLGEGHLCFLVQELVEQLDTSEFEQVYGEEGGQCPYHPRLMLKVWLYAFALNVKTTRKLEQRIREDLGFRYLAGGAAPDHKTLNQFQRRHAGAIRRLFTQVLGLLRRAGLARLGTVALDSTPIKASASRQRLVTKAELEGKVAQWQEEIEDDPERTPGTEVAAEDRARVREQLQKLKASGESKLSTTDPEARFLRERGGFVLGYTAEIAVSEDHFIVAERVTQNKTDNQSLLPLVEEVERQCRARPKVVLADSGFYSNHNLEAMAGRGIEAYVPDSNLMRELQRGERKHRAPRHPLLVRAGEKLRSPAGRRQYERRKARVEPVIGILKQQRGMRQFERRGLGKVAVEFTLAAIAFNLARLHRLRAALR